MPMASRLTGAVSRRLGLEPNEARLLAWMGVLVATLMCAYTVAKVLRDAIFLSTYGALALPYAYVGVAIASAGFVTLEGRAVRRFTHVGAAHFNQFFAIAFSATAAVLFPGHQRVLAAPFYVWTGSQAMMLLPHFWVLALDVWDSRRARRLFPLLGGCGLLGGLAGGAMAGGALPFVHRGGLLWILTALLVLSHGLTRIVESRPGVRRSTFEGTAGGSRWDIIRRSRYIQVFAVGLALSVIVSTLVDFQFKLYIQQTYHDPHALTRFLGKFYVGLNAFALLFQFGVAGWLIQRVGLAASTGLQPTTILLFSVWFAIAAGWWTVVAMRWIQGVIFQTIGKASAEIYYTAVLPVERRVIKPMIDTLVERWSDAVVGGVLIVVLHVFRVPMTAIAIGTGALAAVWLLLLFRLNHYFGRAFTDVMSSQWTEPELPPEAFRLPAARRALLDALRHGDPRRVVLALKLAERIRDRVIEREVGGLLHHASADVRVAAIETLRALRANDPKGVIESLLSDPHEAVRCAAVGYLLSRAPRPTEMAQRLLEGDDHELRRCVLDELFEHPFLAPGAIRTEWIDGLLRSDRLEDVQAAARALGALSGQASVERLRTLLDHSDVEVRRLALLSAARRPDLSLLPMLLERLGKRELMYEARQAVAALSDAAIPALELLLAGVQGPLGERSAARILAEIATPRAVDLLRQMARRDDPHARQVAFQGLARIRMRFGRPIAAQRVAHRWFLRELDEYRVFRDPAFELRTHEAPEIRLLGESYRESADMALERAIQALACWYEPAPLFGVFHRLVTRDSASAAPALEYLGHALPRPVFRAVEQVFERAPLDEPEVAISDERVSVLIRFAWDSEDPWLRACAVRAARRVPGFDLSLFAHWVDPSPVVRSEIEALDVAREGPATQTSPIYPTVSVEAPAC